MKHNKSFLAVSILMGMLTSCATTSYYQVYKVVPTNNVKQNNNALIYEDANSKVTYNFWQDGGDIGFLFYNKTNEDITVHLNQSYFVMNGIAHDYFGNRTITRSFGSSVSASAFNTTRGLNWLGLWQPYRTTQLSTINVNKASGYSVAYQGEKSIIVPAHTKKEIDKFVVTDSLYRDCDLLKYPNKNQLHTKTFQQSQSPFVFSNRIVYTIGSSNDPVKFENEFYVSQITNYPESEVRQTKNENDCGEKTLTKIKVWKNATADQFYVQYFKGSSGSKH